MKSVTIIGFGRFGKTLYQLIKDDFDVTVYQRKAKRGNSFPITTDLQKAYESEVIFYAIPIEAFESVISQHKKFFRPDHVLIDVLAVKAYPAKIFKKHLLGTTIQALLTHPIFGPDSSKNGFANLSIVVNKFLANDETYKFWKNYFESKQLRVIELSAEEHDRLSANSLGLAHFIGRLLDEFNMQPTPIDTVGATKLLEVKEQTCNDTWELFMNMQHYNPHTKEMRIKLGKAYDKLYNKLLPERVNPRYFVYGIQGGIGSFNEEALTHYLTQEKITDYKIEYLYTTEKVLKNLHEGNIDFGLFAITNSTGGLVEETMQALTKYQCTIVQDFQILIKHFLMKQKNTKTENIDTIMAHPQVLKQCERTLAERYSHFKLISGTGDLVDTAKAAERLAKGKLPNNIAILGPLTLAKRYHFDVLDENLQDKKDNYTRFLLVKR
jgi:arogenate dehydrogenase (NADP+), plant